MDVQKADILPLEPFMQDGVEAQPMFELNGAMTSEDYRQYMIVHYWRGSQLYRSALPVAGLILIAWGLMDTSFLQLPERILLCGFGLELLIVFWLQCRTITSSANSYGKSPLAFQYRFFEDGFEGYGDHSMARRPYSDFVKVVFFGGAIYLYVSRSRVYIVPRDSISNRADALLGLLERKTGKKAVRLGVERKQ